MLSFATGSLALSLALDGETVTVGGKEYTFLETLTGADGAVKIGTYPRQTLRNLYDAINLTGTRGVQYASGMTANMRVKATEVTTVPAPFLSLKVVALTPGDVGNLIETAETLTKGAWGDETLTGGEGNVTDFLRALQDSNGADLNAEAWAMCDALIARIASEGEEAVDTTAAMRSFLSHTDVNSATASEFEKLIARP